MDNIPDAAGEAMAPQTEATPNTISQPVAPDMHGFTSDQLADMRRFYDANGGFEKIKAKISNPTPAPAPAPVQEAAPAPAPEPYRAPAGSITPQEFLAQQYFGALSKEDAYSSISQEVASGAILREMAGFNIRPLNDDGSINDQMVRRFLDMKAQTVAAKQSSAMPEASAAPTVDYVPFSDQVTDMHQAMAVLQQDSQLRSAGMAGHPSAAAAEEFMRKQLNPNAGK